MVITEPQEGLKAWLCDRISYVPSPNMVCLGQWSVSKKALVGCVGFDRWTETAVEMHCAGDPGWLDREMLYKAFSYPFIQAGLKVAIAVVSSSNEDALRLNRRLGFREVCRIADAMDDGDMVIMEIRPDECRWLDVFQPSKYKEAV
jgi:L-amino acid N-acyltransferase YncA